MLKIPETLRFDVNGLIPATLYTDDRVREALQKWLYSATIVRWSDKPEPSQHLFIFQDLRVRAGDSRFCEPLLPQMAIPREKA